MNRISLPQWLFVGLFFLLTACQPARQSPGSQSFKPGDLIDGMSLVTGAKEAAPLWAFCSRPLHVENITTSDCHVPIIPRLAIGHIVMPGDETLVPLDGSEINWELTIDDQPIDLTSFGTYDYVLPGVSHNPSSVREVFVHFIAWDVVLTHLIPGEHTIHGLAKMGTDSYSWIIHLTIEDTDLGKPTTWVGCDIQVIS